MLAIQMGAQQLAVDANVVLEPLTQSCQTRFMGQIRAVIAGRLLWRQLYWYPERLLLLVGTMSAMKPQTNRSLLTYNVCWYLTVVAFIAAAFFPEGRIWGGNLWAYFPTWVIFCFAAVSLLAPVAINTLLNHSRSKPAMDNDRRFVWGCFSRRSS